MSNFSARETRSTGIIGENIACGYLVKKGYKIIKRNFIAPFGEIDIIAKSPDNTLIFIEVKALKYSAKSGNIVRQSYPHLPLTQALQNRRIYTGSSFNPEMHLDDVKLRKLNRLCAWYANTYYPESEFRIDGMCVDIFEDGEYNIRHYKNIGYY